MQTRQQAVVQALKLSALLGACMIAPIALLALYPIPPGIYPLWDFANAMGYIALAITLLLFVYKGRARIFPAFSGRFFANLHRDLGYIVVLLLLGHVGLLLWAEPLLLQHLKPTAPLHMLSGLIALILLLLMAVSSIPALRRRVWRDYYFFRHMHAVLAVMIVGLVSCHVLLSAYYINSLWKVGLLAIITLGTVAYYTSGQLPVVSAAVLRIRNSSRYSHMISYGSTLVILLLSLAIVLVNNLEW